MNARGRRWLRAAGAIAWALAVGCSSVSPCPVGTMMIADACVKREQRDDASKEAEPAESMKAPVKSGDSTAAGSGGSLAAGMDAAGAAGQTISMAAGAAAGSGDAGVAGSAALRGDAGMSASSNSGGASGVGATAGTTAGAGGRAGNGGAAVEMTGACGGATCNKKAYCTVNTEGARFCKCFDGGPGNGITPGSCGEECTPGSCGDECAANNGGCSLSPKATCEKRVGEQATCSCPAGTGGSGIGSRGCVFKIDEFTALDNSTRLTWQRHASTQPRAWDRAGQYCSSLSLDGTGWRLPTRAELLVLGDQAFNPSVDPIAFPNTPWGPYWTSNEDGANDALVISFDANVVRNASAAKMTLNNFRCVR